MAGVMLVPMMASAVPAFPGWMRLQQPDGSVLSLLMVGDEHCHVTVDEQGRAMTLSPDGFWRRTGESGDAVLHRLSEDRRRKRRVSAREGEITHFPCVGTPRSLVILVDFPDINFVTEDVHREFDEMLNLPGFDRREHIGCAADYFRTQSMGMFSPQFDVYGPVRADHPATYYGENDAAGNDMRVHELAMEACRKLDGEIDFSDYDLNADGIIDNVYLFYAGYGENFAGNKSSWIWPHANHISTLGIPEDQRRYDGKVLNSYGCCAELYGSYGTDITAIGTFCHEFGHILGLLDTYDVNYAEDGNGYHPDFWDVMAAGSYLPATRNCGAVPAGYSAIERWLLGWAEPVDITLPQSVTLPPLHSSALSARISTSDPDEFFILENRQQEVGSYDRFLPSHGMIAWHVDRRKGATVSVTVEGERHTISCADAWSLEYNALNSNAAHQCLEIEKAGGNGGSKSSLDTPFPGRQGVTSFDDSSPTPMRSWDGRSVGRPVTGIREHSRLVSFDFMGGRSEQVRVEAVAPDPVSDTGCMAHWWPCEAAVDGYKLSLFSTSEHTDTDLLTLDTPFSTLPTDWSASGTYTASATSCTLGGGSTVSELTSPELDLSLGGTLTIRASQSGATAATLTVKVGDQTVVEYLPTAQTSDYTITLPSMQKPSAITLSVARRKAVSIERISLRQDVKSVQLTPLPEHTAWVGAGETSHEFKGLEPEKSYAYTVEAVGFLGSASEPMHLFTSDLNTSISDITLSTCPLRVYTLSGIPLSSEADDASAIESSAQCSGVSTGMGYRAPLYKSTRQKGAILLLPTTP